MNAQARSIIAWIILGLIIGWIAALMSGADATVTFEWIAAGVVGALIGGFLARQLKLNLKTGNRFLERLIAAFIGAVVVLAIASIFI